MLLDPTPSPLESLPIEILRQIASYTPTPSTLCLLRCCQHIYNICYNRTTFLAIIANKNNVDPSTVPESWSVDFLPSTTPARDLARCALADWKLREWIASGRICYDDERGLAFLAWAPHLAVLNHPFVKYVDCVKFLGNVHGYWEGDGFTTCQARAICYPVIYHLLEACRRVVFGQTADELVVKRLRAIKKGVDDFKLNYPLMIDVLLSLIESRISTSRTEQIEVELPKVENMPPVAMFAHLLLPFRLWGDDNFGQRDVPNEEGLTYLVAPKYLEDDEWTGYISDNAMTTSTGYHSLLENIRFRVTDTYRFEGDDSDSDGGYDSDVTTRSAWEYKKECDGVTRNCDRRLSVVVEGREKAGVVDAVGEVYPGGGVHLKMTKEDGEVLRLEGLSTMWGIVGHVVENFRIDHESQLFWLWKKGWSG